MKTVAIVVGHFPTAIDGGAYNDNLKVSEFDFNNKLAPLIAERVRINGARPMIIYRDTYEDLPSDVNATNADVCVSLHCNAFNDEPNGSEVLYHHSSSNGKKLAGYIQSRVVACLGLKDRGIKPIDYDYVGGAGDAGGWLVEKTAMPCVIVEPFFIDSDESLKLAQRKMHELAHAIADGIHEFIQ